MKVRLEIRGEKVTSSRPRRRGDKGEDKEDLSARTVRDTARGGTIIINNSIDLRVCKKHFGFDATRHMAGRECPRMSPTGK